MILHPLRYDAPVSSGYGWRFNGTQFHGGIDFGVPVGTPVFASKSGKIVKVNGANEAGKLDNYESDELQGVGDSVEILHPDGTATRYSHLSASNVQLGQKVKQGQRIGATGSNNGPHLHFEYKKDVGYYSNPQNDSIDPTNKLTTKIWKTDESKNQIYYILAVVAFILAILGGWYLWKKR